MGKQWKKDGKAGASAKKGLVFTKLAREIQVAAKLGGADPEGNSRLKIAIAAAKKASCPNDTIERSIKRGAGLLDDAAAIEELTYEGYGPHGVGIMVECQSDNKVRTVADIRIIFKKNGGNLGESGAVQWMFNRVSMVEGTKAGVGDVEEEAIEVGANDVEKDEDGVTTFYGNPEDLEAIRSALVSRGWDITVAELSYKAKETTTLTDEQKAEVVELLQDLEDNDDTSKVHATIA